MKAHEGLPSKQRFEVRWIACCELVFLFQLCFLAGVERCAALLEGVTVPRGKLSG